MENQLLVGMQRKGKPQWRFLKRIQVELPFDPTNQLLGLYSEGMKPVC